MNKTQRYIAIGIILVITALLGSQYVTYQRQITRHENAIKFWKEEVPKVQKEHPEFQPQNIDEMLTKENQQFENQTRQIYINSAAIIIAGMAGLAIVYYIPKRKKTR